MRINRHGYVRYSFKRFAQHYATYQSHSHKDSLHMGHNSIHIETLSSLVADPIVVDFVKQMNLRNYRQCRHEQQQEMASIYEMTFELLADGVKDHTKWEQNLNTILYDLFRKDDADAWFNRFYDGYSRNIKGRLEFDKIHDYIRGNTILDFGSGGGYLALKCSQEGYNVLTTDVLDNRIEEVRGLPFRPMSTRVAIPYSDDAADTTLVFATLHHIDASDLESVLGEVKRVSTRVIIEEDVYGVPLQEEEFKKVIEDDELLQEFVLLPEEDQLKVLMLHDYVDNAFLRGIPEMNFPFQFKTIPQWHSVLTANGFSVVKTILVGFRRTKEWTGTCHALFIADRL